MCVHVYVLKSDVALFMSGFIDVGGCVLTVGFLLS